jgi:uncharacterized protein (TIGR02266 family)
MSSNESNDGSDKRRHERSGVTLVVEYEGADDFLGDYTENLSSGGTFVSTSRQLELDTKVRLVLSFPGLVRPITIEAVVRWSRGGEDPGVGVEFMPGPAKDALAALVDRIKTRDPNTVARVIRILLVEDNDHVSSLIQDGLRSSARRSFGANVSFLFVTADNGHTALEHLRSERFDAMITDVFLPGVDGPKVIGVARGELGLKDLPIIAVSAGGDDARHLSLAAGANIFLEKPMRLRQVIDTIRTLVNLST